MDFWSIRHLGGIRGHPCALCHLVLYRPLHGGENMNKKPHRSRALNVLKGGVQ